MRYISQLVRWTCPFPFVFEASLLRSRVHRQQSELCTSCGTRKWNHTEEAGMGKGTLQMCQIQSIIASIRWSASETVQYTLHLYDFISVGEMQQWRTDRSFHFGWWIHIQPLYESKVCKAWLNTNYLSY